MYRFAVDIFPRCFYTWDKNLNETENRHEEHFLFCLLLLYYARIVRLICDAEKARLRVDFMRHRLDLCRIFHRRPGRKTERKRRRSL